MNVRGRLYHQGLTLIELMVAIVIALLLAIAVASVLGGFEGRRRSGTAVNDINQAGNYAAWVLDGLLRSAGSGFTQTAAFSFGCKLLAARNNVTILPAPSALPAPFRSIDRNFRLAPVLIVQNGTIPGDSGAGSDALVVMGGAAGGGEVPAYLNGYPGTSALPMTNTLAFRANDLLMLVDEQVTSVGVSPCMLSQVSSAFTQQSGSTTLDLGGTYYQGTISNRSLSAYSSDAVALNLGNVTSGNPPSFMLIGVGDNSTLYSYDLLRTGSTPQQAVTSGVFELHALYGLDTNGDDKIDGWSLPSGGFSYAALTTGSSVAAERIAQIKAIRVGLILRTALREKTDVSPVSLKLFGELGTGFAYSPTLSGDNTKYRYRTLDFTVPIRNAMMLE